MSKLTSALAFVAAIFGAFGCATHMTEGPMPPPNLIARQKLFGNPARVSATISPDGSKVGFVAPVDGVQNVWIGPADDPSAARPITRDTKRGIWYYAWAYTNQHIIYIQDVGGDENWHVYVVDLSSGEIRDLTPIEGVQAQIQRVSHRRPSEIVVAINDRDETLHDPYLVDLTSGERTLLEKNPGFAYWIYDDDYTVRFGGAYTEGGSVAIHQRTTTGQWDEFLVIDHEDTLTTQPLGFDGTGDVLYMLDSRNRNTAGLFALDTKTANRKLIYENPRADVDDVLLHPTSYTVQAASATFERRHWEVLDDSIRQDFEYLGTVADGEIDIVSRTLDDREWIVGFEIADGPYGYYLYDRDARSAKLLFTYRPDLEGEALAAMHPELVKSRDGLELVSYLTLPVESDPDRDGRPREALPMVLFVHGGPWGRDYWGFNEYHQWLANRGYAVLSVNFRGSTGMGKAFVNAGDLEWGAKMHDDLIDAVEWAVTEEIADRSRVAIMGGSYGGYATLVGLTFTPETFACGVDIVGPSNLFTLIESIPPYWQPMIELFAMRVGDTRTESGRRLLIERSPLTHVDRIQKPLLIGQGANDPRVKQQESDQIVSAMQSKGIPVTYALFPDEGHGFARPENNLAFNALTEAFLGECLGGRVEPIGEDLAGSSLVVTNGADQIEGLAELVDPNDTTPDVGAGVGP
jgi:dipeptidyl aminopeptidase/acylaminoacyl peptidase